MYKVNENLDKQRTSIHIDCVIGNKIEPSVIIIEKHGGPLANFNLGVIICNSLNEFNTGIKFESRVIPFNSQPSLPNFEPAQFNPIAKSLSDLITAKQMGMLRALCKELELKPDNVVGSIYPQVKHDELSKKAASNVLSYLQEEEVKRFGENPRIFRRK